MRFELALALVCASACGDDGAPGGGGSTSQLGGTPTQAGGGGATSAGGAPAGGGGQTQEGGGPPIETVVLADEQHYVLALAAADEDRLALAWTTNLEADSMVRFRLSDDGGQTFDDTAELGLGYTVDAAPNGAGDLHVLYSYDAATWITHLCGDTLCSPELTPPADLPFLASTSDAVVLLSLLGKVLRSVSSNWPLVFDEGEYIELGQVHRPCVDGATGTIHVPVIVFIDQSYERILLFNTTDGAASFSTGGYVDVAALSGITSCHAHDGAVALLYGTTLGGGYADALHVVHSSDGGESFDTVTIVSDASAGTRFHGARLVGDGDRLAIAYYAGSSPQDEEGSLRMGFGSLSEGLSPRAFAVGSPVTFEGYTFPLRLAPPAVAFAGDDVVVAYTDNKGDDLSPLRIAFARTAFVP